MTKPKYIDLRREVIDICLRMNEEGINRGTSGNVSVRNEEGFLITASGIPYKKMKPEHVVQMDVDGSYMGAYLPSTEWRMHLDIFKARPEAKAIVHVHSTYATALSTLRKDIPPFHYMIGVTGGSTLRVSDYAEFGTQELSNTMLKAMEGRNSCLLANHGQICFGPNLEKALWLAGEIEGLCEQYWAATLAGKPVFLDDALMTSVLKRFKSYGKQSSDMSKEADPAVFAPKLKAGDIYEASKKAKKKDKKKKSNG
jgi:L-fuculose-phosphate aldolase